MVKSKTSPNIILAAMDSRATGETYPVVATVPWKEGVENDNLYIFQDTTKLNPTFLIGSNEQLDINPRSKSFTLEAVKIGVSTGEKTYADLNVTQEKATYEYTLEIKSKSGEITIPASGGSLELKGILTTWRNGRKVSTLETPFTMSGYAPGFSISGKTVTASNRGTIIGPSRAINIVGYTNNTIDGSTISGSVVITQAENKVTKVAPSVTLSYNPSEIPAKGGTSSPVVGNISYVTTFSSGETLNDLPTSEYIDTITKTNTFKIHTSNSPFSIDESTGIVTIGTRGTTLGETLEETIYLTHIVQISYKDNIFEPTNNSITRTADITQQANTVTYSDINIPIFGAADIPASGGQVSSGTVYYSQVASYTSGEFENITTGATITYSDPVSADSKDITISNATVAGTLEVTVSLNGKTATKTTDVYQEQNKVTKIELLDSWPHIYSAKGTAAQNSAGPDLVSRTYNVKYTFLSGATSTDKPGTEFGTLSDTVNYSWPGPSGSFTGLSSQSGNVTMASLGTTIINETTSYPVTRTDKVTWTPSSNYSYKTLESNEIQKQARVTRKGNYVEDIKLPDNVFGLSYNPSEIPAKGGSSNPVITQSVKPTMVYSSGAIGDPGDIPATLYGNLIETKGYSFTSSNSSWSINTTTGVVTVTQKPAAASSQSSAGVKYNHNFRWVPSTSYNGGGADITRQATATVYQQANTIETETISIDSFVYENDIPILGGSSSPSLSMHIDQIWTSEATSTRPLSAGYQDTYAFVGTAPSTFSIDSDTGVVTATEAEVSQELKANIEVEVSVANWDGTSTLTESAQAEVAQPAGTVIYNTPVITISYPQVPASGGTVLPVVKVTQAWGWNDDYDEGVNTFDLATLPAGSYSFVGTDPSTTGGQVTIDSKGTVESGVTTPVTVEFTVTLNGKTATKQVGVTQEANTPTVTSAIADWATTGNFSAAGGTYMIELHAVSTFTSGDTSTVAVMSTDPNISMGIVGITGATTSYGRVSVPSRGSTVGPALSGSVTGSYGGVNFDKTLSCTQVENKVTKLEAAVNNTSTATVHFYYPNQPIPASGGTAASVGNGKAIITFSSGQVVDDSNPSGSKYGGTISYARAYAMLNENGFSINTGNGSVTAENRGTTVGPLKTSPVITGTFNITFIYPSSMGGGSETAQLRGTQTVSQQANEITAYGNPTGGTLTAADIPASGGTRNSGTIGGTVSQTRTYTSGSNDTYSQATPTNGSYNSVTANSLGTTIANRTSKGTLTYTYTLNGKSGSISATVYQAGNYVTNLAVRGSTFSYANIGAGATSATPTVPGDGLFTYTFSSGSTSNTTPSTTYGNLVNVVTYSLGSVQNGFTAVNSSSGVLTATSYGTTVGPARTSGVVTRTIKSTWTPTASYNSAGIKTAQGSTTATCTQNQNRLLNGDYNGSNSNYTAKCTLLANQLTAAGGTATFGGSATHTHTYYIQYDSGTYGPYISTVSDSINLSMVGNGNSRFSFANSVASHSSMTTNVTTDTVTIRCTNTASTSVYHDASASVANAKIRQYNTNTGSQYYECSGTYSVYYQDYITYGEYTAGTFQIGSGRTEVRRSQVDGQCGYTAKITVNLSIYLSNPGGSGQITASRAVNDSLSITWSQHDNWGNGQDNWVTMSKGQISVTIYGINMDWTQYEIFQVNMQSSSPWVSGNWSYYW